MSIQNIGRMSARLENVDQQLKEMAVEMTTSRDQSKMKDDLETLRRAREKLQVECDSLQAQTGELSVNDERRLVLSYCYCLLGVI